MNPSSGVLTHHSISSELAHALVAAAEKQAREIGLAISVCLLESSGRIKAFSAMDGAPPVSYEASIKKARTALGFGMNTGQDWYGFIKDDPILLNGVAQLPDFILLGGGSPLKWKGSVIGAIGISGGHYKQDEICVAAAVSELERRLSL
jgi:uncharacterized protein GlcG (DUF336 family)